MCLYDIIASLLCAPLQKKKLDALAGTSSSNNDVGTDKAQAHEAMHRERALRKSNERVRWS